jgi:outer membrane biosynthesis protein TonB
MRTLSALLLVSGFASGAHANEKRVAPVVSIKTTGSKAMMESSLTVDVVSAMMKATYHAHIEHCYRDVFSATPKASAKGTLKLIFGVEPDGKTFAPVAASFDKKLDACVLEKMRAWTFPVPKDKADKPTKTRFFYELVLAPITGGDPLAKKKKGEMESVEISEEDVTRFADMLTAEGPTDHQGDMRARRPGADLGQQLDAARNGPNNTSVSSGGVAKEKGPPGRISVTSSSALEATSLTPDVVLRKIQTAYMAGIKRCYKLQLKKDPTMRGKLKLSFTVNEAGRATSVKAASFSADLDTCVKGLMTNWRFPAPKVGDAAAEATFEYALSLVPD